MCASVASHRVSSRIAGPAFVRPAVPDSDRYLMRERTHNCDSLANKRRPAESEELIMQLECNGFGIIAFTYRATQRSDVYVVVDICNNKSDKK